jgi:aminoglycoside phosphotransferase (APT) family kinase protein
MFDEANKKIEERIDDICEKVFDIFPDQVEPIVGKGRNNLIFKISVMDELYILRINNSSGQLEKYNKELWCSGLLQDSKVKIPKIIKVGILDGWAYSFQEFVEGVSGKDAEKYNNKIWFTLGKYAKTFNQIPADEIALDYKSKIEGLFEEGFFVSQGMFSPEISNQIEKRLRETYSWEFSPTLAHGNLSGNNVVVDSSENIWLIDWETATGNISPIADLAEIYTWNTGKENIDTFCKGYELSPSEHKLQMRNIQTLILLRMVEVIRKMFANNSIWESNDYIVSTIRKFNELKEFDADVLFTKNL